MKSFLIAALLISATLALNCAQCLGSGEETYCDKGNTDTCVAESSCATASWTKYMSYTDCYEMQWADCYDIYVGYSCGIEYYETECADAKDGAFSATATILAGQFCEVYFYAYVWDVSSVDDDGDWEESDGDVDLEVVQGWWQFDSAPSECTGWGGEWGDDIVEAADAELTSDKTFYDAWYYGDVIMVNYGESDADWSFTYGAASLLQAAGLAVAIAAAAF